MVSNNKHEDKTNKEGRSLIGWILGLGIMTAVLFLFITFGAVMG